ncbi:type II secretion system F family protein [Nocardiopsis dassonvillei]|uniref:type II secretion system F family protein n=1 Tax=Nocardiopsis dassonvillei TaxID=2014 RepID=UPI00366D29C0
MTTVLAASLGGAAVGLGLVLLWPAFTAAPGFLRSRVSVRRDTVFRAVAAFGAGVLAWGVTGWPVAAVLAAAAAWWLPAVLGPDRATAAEIARIEAVAGWTEQLRDLITASSGLRQAIWTSCAIAPEAVRGDVQGLAADLTAGNDLEDALTAFAHRVDNETADLGTLLGSLAEAARDRASMLVRTSTSRARTRTSVRIITAASLAMVIGMAALNGPYFAPLGSTTGQLVLALVGTVWAAALWWLTRLSAPPRTERVLSAHEQEERV